MRNVVHAMYVRAYRLGSFGFLTQLDAVKDEVTVPANNVQRYDFVVLDVSAMARGAEN